jgi:hypothetical protein
MDPYRIFISYSHEDRDIAERVAAQLAGLGFRPMWDKDLLPGVSFTDQIKRGIAYAHVFLPVLTEASSKRPWVHQEIGYAMGLDIPVLPLAVGKLPGEMIQQLQAVNVSPHLDDLANRLTAKVLKDLMSYARVASRASFQCGDLPEQRAEMLAQYAKRVLEFGAAGRVRQSGGFSSFCLPNKNADHPDWARREGGSSRSAAYRKLLREERRMLEQHAREAGCDLIIDLFSYKDQESGARKARLKTLVQFLESMSEGKVRVVIRPTTETGNLLIVGDWFVAESKTRSRDPEAAFVQTILTTHAPTVLDRAREFDELFEELLTEEGLPGNASRVVAIERINAELRQP